MRKRDTTRYAGLQTRERESPRTVTSQSSITYQRAVPIGSYTIRNTRGIGVVSRGKLGSIGDVNGDGWYDVMFANYRYPDYPINDGTAIVVAGGPYIPNDDPVVGVRQIALENKSAAPRSPVAFVRDA
jgi:hypothetical protein